MESRCPVSRIKILLHPRSASTHHLAVPGPPDRAGHSPDPRGSACLAGKVNVRHLQRCQLRDDCWDPVGPSALRLPPSRPKLRVATPPRRWLSFLGTDMTHYFRNAALFTIAAITSLVVLGCGSTATGRLRSWARRLQARAPQVPAGTVWLCARNDAEKKTPATPGKPAHITGLPAGYLPLYPFASLTDVRGWQASHQSGGHQPWHLSPDITATAFAAFLGYTGVTQVARSTVSGGAAHVTVGIKLPNGTISAVAVVHLLRFGSWQGRALGSRRH